MFRLPTWFYRLAAVVVLIAPALAWGNLEAGADAYNGGDYALALHELLPMAEKGNGDAQYIVGQMFANGQGVPKNEATAADWYLQSAGNGNANAQLALGDMYALGKGVVEDDAIAAYWRWRGAVTSLAIAKRKLNAGLKNADAAKDKGNANPIAANCAAPTTARDASHFGEGGTVDLLVLVDADGKALETSILNSSDWPRLDQAARDAFNACAYAPAKADGKPVPGLVKMSYVWKPN